MLKYSLASLTVPGKPEVPLSGLLCAVYDVRLKFNVLGYSCFTHGTAPIILKVSVPPHPSFFFCMAIQSLVDHTVSIVLDSNMVATLLIK